MILTKEEARLWGEILIGFSQGKEYVYPRAYNKDFEVVEWMDLTDFVINEDTPTIRLTGSSAISFLTPKGGFMSTKKERIMAFILEAIIQGVINGIVLFVILKIFKVV